MKIHANLSLEGTYSVDIYKRDGTIKQSIGPNKNFITSTGLSYISKYAIADCFRFLSLGEGDAVNTLNGNNGWGTKYLEKMVSKFSYIGGRDTYADAGHANSQYADAGFEEHISGVTLSRSWRVPSGAEVFFDQDYTFEEVMLSPGRGYEVGISQTPMPGGEGRSLDLTAADLLSANFVEVDGEAWETNQWINNMINITHPDLLPQRRLITSNTLNNPEKRIYFTPAIDTSADNQYAYSIHPIYQLCHCSDSDTDIDGNLRNGLDYSSATSYYSGVAHTDICAGSGAFARMVQTIDVSQDDYLIFNYDLKVSMETGIHSFTMNMVGRNSRGALANTNWGGNPSKSTSYISGVHQLVHHGLKMISPGSVATSAPWGGAITQDDNILAWDADFDFGESFVGSWGCPLEPSILGTKLTAYLTNDNLQFFANSKNGGAYDSSIAGFSGTSGLMAWRQDPYTESAANGFNEKHCNIRRDNTSVGVRTWPVPTDYSTETDDPSTFTHVVKSMLPTFDTAVAHSSFANPSDRTRTVTRSFQFDGRDATEFANDSTVKGAQIRGIVLAYVDTAQPDYLIPYLDCLFTDTGKGTIRLLPQKNAPSAGQYATGNVQTPGTDTLSSTASYWYYLEDNAKLTFTFQETWGSPCSPTVEGCPGYVP